MGRNKKIGFTIVMCLLLIVITIGVTYAAFSFTKEGTIENILETGTVNLTYTEGKTGIVLEDAFPISDEAGKLLTGENNVFDFTVQATLGNPSGIGYEVTAVKVPITGMEALEDNEVKLYLERAIDPETEYTMVMSPSHFMPRTTQSEIGSPIGSMILDQGMFTTKGTTLHHYRLRMWVDENTEIGEVQKKYEIKVNVYAKQGVIIDDRNRNITNIYAYDETNGSSTFCVTGEEATCVELYQAPATYPVGTILKYKVNDSTEKYFHVVSDNGDTLTLQQRENTVYSTAWYGEAADNSKGPTTILAALEAATSTWSNVLDQTYELGTTVFKDNAYTGCSSYNSASCTTNKYTLPSRTAKARMITIQETESLGCTTAGLSCPVWVYNYLYNVINYGGTVNQTGGEYGNNHGYWTASAYSSNATCGLHINYYGHTTNTGTSNKDVGGRAVVIVQK